MTSDGYADQDIKQTYAHAFAIYGLAEHFKATGDERSLNAAIGIYRTIEEKVHDHKKGGYQEVLARDFSKVFMAECTLIPLEQDGCIAIELVP